MTLYGHIITEYTIDLPSDVNFHKHFIIYHINFSSNKYFNTVKL